MFYFHIVICFGNTGHGKEETGEVEEKNVNNRMGDTEIRQRKTSQAKEMSQQFLVMPFPVTLGNFHCPVGSFYIPHCHKCCKNRILTQVVLNVTMSDFGCFNIPHCHKCCKKGIFTLVAMLNVRCRTLSMFLGRSSTLQAFCLQQNILRETFSKMLQKRNFDMSRNVRCHNFGCFQ